MTAPWDRRAIKKKRALIFYNYRKKRKSLEPVKNERKMA
jgi:hypothetical protein